MEINTRQVEGVAILDLEGKVIGRDSLQLKQAIDDVIASSAGAPKLLFNLGGVTMMDSSGVGTLIGAHLSVARKGGRIGVINVGSNIRSLLVMARIITVLQHFNSEEEAIKSLQSP
jgi:anti-sigma B factor antagonist